MKERYPFGEVLASLRRAQGHARAYTFYKSCGGARVLGMSFPNYLAMERGSSLPKPFRLKTLFGALHLEKGSSGRIELVRAYLASQVGAELLEELDSASPEKNRQSFEGEIARLAVRQKAVNMTLEQWTAVSADRESYFIDTYLQNTPGLVDIAEIARAAGISEAKATAALKKLAAAGLIELLGRRARSVFAYKLIKSLPALPATVGVKGKLNRYFDEISRASKPAHDAGLYVRMSKRSMGRYIEYIDNAIEMSSAYGDVEKGKDNALYCIELKIGVMAE